MITGRLRWLATLLAGLFGILAIFSGLDRFSEHQPSAIRLVPEAFRVDALRVEAARALASGDAERAEALASKVILAGPHDARGPAFLGAARLMAGEQSSANEAFAVARSMGLREPLVQAHFFDTALTEGDYAEAARQLDILLRAHPRLARIDYFFTSLEASEEGRARLAARLSDDPLWSGSYLGDFHASDEVLRSRARFLAEAGGGLNLSCRSVEPLVRELTQRNYMREARDISRTYCARRNQGGLLADPQFEELGNGNTFGWRRHGSGDVRISSVGESDKAVEIENRAGVTRLVLSQPIVLEAGEYRVFGSVAGANADRVLISVTCSVPGRPRGGGGALGRGQLVSAPDCPDQVLGIWLRPGSGALRLDDMRMERVGD
ncbi:tetratricopeptide repeat protein [Qipengyuania aquimaris]|uniref:tetratricopeptide repeat protein n=1 Tax=Qipengyuania aquimaris TaxID=255984 RepID=UPI001FD537C7|nr:hypothetical protein [Qipengyuania aquimaris]UOR14299.1 hypothetical protein LCM05_07230 [Qipengyuania aquimaris]